MAQTLTDIGEFGLIRHIHELLGRAGPQAVENILGIGDDCASFKPHEGLEMLVTCDCMIEGRHYIRKYISPMDIGRRAMVMNISDIGAMGGHPLYALISLGLRGDTPIEDIDGMYLGFIEELKPFKANIIGGNITRSEYYNFIDITLIGEVEKDVIMRRSTARKGDSILVTGSPGQAAAGLRLLLSEGRAKYPEDHPLVRAYIRPVHRAKEGRAIAKSGYARAMIDISDGLLGDLWHICEESGVGAEIIQEKIPISEYLHEIALEPDRLYDMVIGDSDDYELIITCPSENVDKIRSIVTQMSDISVAEIGRITDISGGVRIVLPDGTMRKMSSDGWDHFRR